MASFLTGLGATFSYKKMYKCKGCGKTKPRDGFYKQKCKVNGLRGKCKSCWTKQTLENRKNDIEKYRKYRREYKKNNPLVKKERREWMKKDREKNPKKYRDRDRKRLPDRKKWRNDFRKKPREKINHRIGNAIRVALSENKKGRRWESLVGYTLEDLIKHIEGQFRDGMSWENFDKIHIDHIKPRASFNYTKPEDPEFKECWALENLQPLWASENIKKSNKDL